MGSLRKARPFYKITRIFGPTIKGEGSHSGRKVLVVNFSGCNRWSGTLYTKNKSICSFCDSFFLSPKKMTARQIVDKLLEKNGNHLPRLPVVLSGGEPALQVDEKLMVELKESFSELHIETNGSKKLVFPRFFLNISLNPKQSIEKTNLKFCHDLKILYPFIHKDITLEKFMDFPSKNIYLQPIEEDGYFSAISHLNRKLTKEFLLKVSIPNKEVRISCQINKLMEVE